VELQAPGSVPLTASSHDAAAAMSRHACPDGDGRRRRRHLTWVAAVLPAGRALPAEQWDQHHGFVLRVLAALAVLVPLYAVLRGYDLLHAAGHVAPLLLLTLVARCAPLPRASRAAAAAAGLMTASALVVHASHGATEAHFMFFALLPLAAVYAARTPFLLAVGYVAVHHFVLGSLAPAWVFENRGPALGMAALHAAFVLAESLACLVAWRLFEDRRELVERLVLERTAELRRQHDALARLAAVVEATDDAVVTTTSDGVITTWNRGAERLYGYRSNEVTGEHIGLVYAPERQDELELDRTRLDETSSVHVERLLRRKDGSCFEAMVTISNIYDADGAVSGRVGITRDISERKRSEARTLATARKLEAQTEELTQLALHDPLTGLANRTLMHDRLDRALASRAACRHAVLLLDLDDFKSVNDVWGHGVGDAVLIEVARRLTACIRPTDTVARLGGDEFVVVIENVTDSQDAVDVARRILAQLDEPVQVGDEQFLVTGSVGVTLTDGADGRSATELLRDADIAMYGAKAAGKGRCEVFETDMHDKVVAHAELLRDLRSAIDNDELRVLYQPQVHLSSGRVVGVEALVRWEHPERGLVTPDAFIPVAESTGGIVAIDDWVLREACRQLRAWDDVGLGPLNLAINVSAGRLVTGDLAGTVATVVQDAGIEPSRLEIEITETVAVDEEPEAVAAITAVRALGVRVALDDFGMGHSSLSRLQTFPLDRLKIDRSFVAPLTKDAASGSIADVMIALGQGLGLEVVAEGVESDAQVEALRSLGCDVAQGYLFGRPAPAAEIERLVRIDARLGSQPRAAAGDDAEASGARCGQDVAVPT
jgi:diguanylate cyclase (GGDEF)-like protein/PAS domain S-box-containing protein